MRKINLKAKNLSNEHGGKRYSGQTSLVAGVILLFLAATLYGGVWYLKSSQDKKISVIKNDIQILKNDLDKNKEYKKLYDFQDRLLETKYIFKNKVIQTNILNQISETTMNENVLKNLKITMKNGLSDIKLTVQTSDLDTLAKQINAYGQVDVNKQALLKGSSLGEEGVEASLGFSVGNLNNFKK